MEQLKQKAILYSKYFFNCQKIIPYHDIGNALNPTGILDFLKWEEIKEPVVHGIDILDRYFIVIKMIINGERIMETFFQRYPDSEYFISCGNATCSLLLDTYEGIDKLQFKLIGNLINNGEVVIKEDHRPNNHSWIGKYVYIYDGEDILIR
jgi:hypothetical protein